MLPHTLLNLSLPLEEQAQLLQSAITAPPPAISPEQLIAAEDALEDVHLSHGAEAMVLKLHAQQKDWRVELQEKLRAGGSGEAEVEQARSAVDGVRELAYLTDEALMVEADSLWKESSTGITSSSHERQQ